MGKAAAILGQVVRKTGGQPVAGARVDVSPYLAAGDSGRAVTDSGGNFTVGGLAPGSYDVVVRGAGFSEALERGITVGNGDQYTLKVEVSGTATIEGTVTDGAGKGVRGAVVTAQGALADNSGVSASTDGEGKYQLAGVQVGRVGITATRVEGGYRARSVVELAEGETEHADFQLPDTSALEGRVLAKGGGRLRLSVSVRMFAPAKRRWQDADVDPEDGSFRVEVPPDDYRVVVLDESNSQRGSLASQSVKVEAGKVNRVEFTIDDSEQTQGTWVQVLEPGGVPSPEAQLWVMRGGRPVHGYRADETGRANLGPIKGEGLVLKAWNGGRAGEVTFSSNGGSGDLTITLKPAASLRGRVTGSGAPVKGFTLEVDAAEWRPGGSGPLSFPGDELWVSDLPGGPTSLKVATPDGRKGSATVTLQPGATAEVSVALDAAAAPGG
jgi:protocatechuate 3,4-dioxygenase beta subunit